jgi:hypothetical protein
MLNPFECTFVRACNLCSCRDHFIPNKKYLFHNQSQKQEKYARVHEIRWHLLGKVGLVELLLLLPVLSQVLACTLAQLLTRTQAGMRILQTKQINTINALRTHLFAGGVMRGHAVLIELRVQSGVGAGAEELLRLNRHLGQLLGQRPLLLRLATLARTRCST